MAQLLPLPNLVLLALMSLIYNDSFGVKGQQQRLTIISLRDGQRHVFVLDNGTILTSRDPPTLNSLIRIHMNETLDNFNSCSLEAVANKYKICMNKTGKLYTKAKGQRRWRTSIERHGKYYDGEEIPYRHHMKKKKRRKPTRPDECIFRIYQFSPEKSFFRKAFYSVAYSNETVGRFIAFGQDGYPRSMKKPFENLHLEARVGMVLETAEPPKETIQRLIQNTTFHRKKSYNRAVRQCLQNFHKKTNIFDTVKRRHEKRRSIYNVIQKCKRNRNSGTNPRKHMRQNSLQRYN